MLPETVQTSPYITCVYPGQPAPVTYLTDTLAPSYPVLTDAGDAKFGIIGLDREVVWRSDLDALTALEVSAAEPRAIKSLIERFGAALISDLVSAGWLQDPADLCKEYWFRTAQIEVTAHCNWGCRFCPVSTDPKKHATMPMSLFSEIIEKLAPFETIKFVTFHFFNEPTLDRYFEQRIQVLAEYGMKLALFTNASGLTPKKIQALRASGVLYHLIVNLPTLEGKEFRELTGASTYESSVRNIAQAIDVGFLTKIVVNGVGDDLDRNLEMLRQRYEPLGVEVQPTMTCDRVGIVGGEYYQGVHVSEKLNGCSWPLNHAYFSVNGDMFICCNDYHQREVFGNIRDGSIDDIMMSPAALRVRRRVFGVEDAPGDYICRSCHNQRLDFVGREFRPLATFPLQNAGYCGVTCGRGGR